MVKVSMLAVMLIILLYFHFTINLMQLLLLVRVYLYTDVLLIGGSFSPTDYYLSGNPEEEEKKAPNPARGADGNLVFNYRWECVCVWSVFVNTMSTHPKSPSLSPPLSVCA